MITTLIALRTRINAITSKLTFMGPLLIRLVLGIIFIQTGWGKLNSLGDVTEYFASLGIPMPGLNAAVAASTEFLGGILLLVGLGARVVALPMAFTMVVAILTARRADIEDVSSLLRFDETAYLVMFLVIAFIGAGAASLDALLVRRFFGKNLPQPLLTPNAAAAAAKV